MKNFTNDTKDCIERLYKDKILAKFPLYAEFWNKFIGVRDNNRNGLLTPYGLIIPRTLQVDKTQVRKSYMEMTYAHYTLFCNLAGAHYQLENLSNTKQLGDTRIRHFQHWECFESIYSHLVMAQYQVYHLWRLIFSLQGASVSNGQGGVKGALERLLIRKRKKYLLKKNEKTYKEIVILRNNITHFSRGISRILNGGEYAIPRRVKKNIHWNKHLRYKSWVKTNIKAKNDLSMVEKLCNELHVLLIEEFERYISNTGIRIKY